MVGKLPCLVCVKLAVLQPSTSILVICLLVQVVSMKTAHVTHQQASELLHNKFVVVLGDSIQRGVYKDLVVLLQKDNYLSLPQLRTKGEEAFENDELLEGGRRGLMTNGTEYKEVRQYTSDHHQVRFYFLTRIYSDYVERILEDFKKGPKPDLVIINSCVWDVSRYGRQWEPDYLENLTMFFGKLRTILPDEVLIIWNVTMPLGKTIVGGFLVPEIAEYGPSLRFDIIEANYCSATLANAYGLNVLDLHFQFRFSLQHRMKDGVHWNAVAHRRITCLLLEHVANAWGVELPPSQPPTGLNQSFCEHDPTTKEMHQQPRKAQSSVTRRRPKACRYRNGYNYPVPPTTWMTPLTSNYYEGCCNHWTQPPYVQGPAGFSWNNRYGNCDMDQHPYSEPQYREPYFRGDQDFSNDLIPPQAGSSYDDNCGYVMRKKYSRRVQYRPY